MIVKTHRPRITVDGRGKISTGMRDSRGLPKKLDYFDITLFPELKQYYGEKPTKLLIYFPTDDPNDFYNSAFNAWGSTEKGPVKKRSCDGETCLHRIDEKVGGKQYAAGEETECICKDMDPKDKARCRFDCYFKAYIGDPHEGKIRNPSCYMFTTHSQNSADAVLTEIMKIKDLNGGVLRAVPFVLSVKIHSSREDAKKKFPIWSLQMCGTMKTLEGVKKSLAGLGIDKPLVEYQKSESTPQEDASLPPEPDAGPLFGGSR